MKTTCLILLGKLESELLGVVVDILHILKNETDEALISSSERVFLGSKILDLPLCLSYNFLRLGFGIFSCTLDFRSVVTLVVIVVTCTDCNRCGNAGIKSVA